MFIETIKEWTQDGFDLRAYTTPDESGIRPEDVEQGPTPEDTPEWIDTWHSRLNQFEGGAWYYVGVIVEASIHGVKLGNASLWAIESDATEYQRHLAYELAPEAISEAQKTLDKLLAIYAKQSEAEEV